MRVDFVEGGRVAECVEKSRLEMRVVRGMRVVIVAKELELDA